MKRRLRKKKRLGEFKELGFEVQGDLKAGLGHADLEAFADRFIEHVEKSELSFGGRIGEVLDGFVTRNGRGSATEADRVTIAAFLERDADVVRHEVRPLVDAWHGWD